LIIRDIKS